MPHLCINNFPCTVINSGISSCGRRLVDWRISGGLASHNHTLSSPMFTVQSRC